MRDTARAGGTARTTCWARQVRRPVLAVTLSPVGDSSRCTTGSSRWTLPVGRVPASARVRLSAPPVYRPAGTSKRLPRSRCTPSGSSSRVSPDRCWSNVLRPNRSSRAWTRCSPSHHQVAPISSFDPATDVLSRRPPVRLRASTTVTSTPRAASWSAAARPPMPAPTTSTAVSTVLSSIGFQHRPESCPPGVQARKRGGRLVERSGFEIGRNPFCMAKRIASQLSRTHPMDEFCPMKNT